MTDGLLRLTQDLRRVKVSEKIRINPEELEGVSPGLKAALTKKRYTKFEVVSLREVLKE